MGCSGRGEDGVRHGEVLYYGWDHHGVIMELLVATRTKSSSFVRLVGHGSRKRAIASNQFCPARASSIISSIIDIDYDFIYLVPPDDQ